MSREKVALMYGGCSAEHEISVITALQTMQAIDSLSYEVIPIYYALSGKWYTGDALFERKTYKNFSREVSYLEEVTLLPDPTVNGFTRLSKKGTIDVDICFLAFHGQYGEDGCIQGLLELADLPYTGSGVLSSAIAMNKYQSKIIAQSYGIPVLPSVLAKKSEAIENLKTLKEKILHSLTFPLFVKPNHLGSSIGISAATNERNLYAALAKVFQYDDAALIEPKISHLLELNAAVLDGIPPVVSVIEIPVARKGALSYEDKYLRKGTKCQGEQSAGMAGLTRVVDPVDIDPFVRKLLIDAAKKAFISLGCSGMCRLDFMLDMDKKQLYFNEINPIPGSFAYYLWEKSDPPILYTELIDQLLRQAKTRKTLQRSLKRNLGFKAL